MQRHWRTVAPPVNVTLAAFVGFKPKQTPLATSDAFDIDEFLKVAQLFQG